MELTREKVLAMEAGRELDALVVEKVMGYKFVQEGSTLWKDDAPFPFVIYDEEFGYCLYEKYEDGWPFTTFNPSADISAAWAVHTEINKRGWGMCLLDRYSHGPSRPFEYGCQLGKDGVTHVGYGETAPLAICRAALLTTLTE